MSKSIDLLKAAREQKLSKYSAALSKAGNGNPENLTPDLKVQDSKKGAWLPALLLAAAFLLIVVINIFLFISVQRKFSNFKVFEGAIVNNKKNIAVLSSSFKQAEQELKTAGIKIQDGNKRISELEKLYDANMTRIENLTRSKNTLFEKTSKLEAELNNLKSANVQNVQ